METIVYSIGLDNMVEQIDSQGTFDRLCSELNYKKNVGLVTSAEDTEDPFQKYIFSFAKDKLDVDAIFFYSSDTVPSVPFIYFKKFESEDPQKIAELHKLVWNMGQAPLLFIILPSKVLIYNSYKAPKIDNSGLDFRAGLIEELQIFIDVEKERRARLKYESLELLTGNYWKIHHNKFDKKERVNESLLENLDIIRKNLLKEQLPTKVIHNLIIRTIFIKYLEDRKDKLGNRVFPDNFFKEFLGSADKFVDLLSDKQSTYSLFRKLSETFNGDLFFLDNEETVVSQKHLNLLQRMLKGEEYLKSGQRTLWPLYSFDVIPIELISNIYQKFVHSGDNQKEKKGSHYTPPHLATFLMDQVLPWEDKEIDIRILDPSCGSGIFLVEGYRRLIRRWKVKNNENPSISDLNQILKENLFGVDISYEAIQIAALSLYLTLCDNLEPRIILKNLVFERLINNNLFVSDFFSDDLPFAKEKYDIIIGNPPWESQLSDLAFQYIKRTSKPVGDKQICQAFLWRVQDLCKPTTEICMIVSSKSLLFNRNPKNRLFRNDFFSSVCVKSIINFSLLRRILYSEAIGPCAAITFSPNDLQSNPIVYCTPKPCYSPQDDWLFIIEPQDIAKIRKEDALEDDLVWKVAMWGAPRDYELIKRLAGFPSLKGVCDTHKWVDGEGFTIGGKERKLDLWLSEKPYVDVKRLEKFYLDETTLPKCGETHFYRSVKNKRKIFKGPHLLIKQSPKQNGLVAALLEKDTVFNGSIVGIHADSNDINKLAFCCAIINSNLSLYYQMLTSRKWLVERDELQKEEIMNIPISEKIHLTSEFTFQKLKEFSKNRNDISELNELINKWYNLSDSELILIDDAINYTLDFYNNKKKSIALLPAKKQNLNEYLNIYCKILNNSFLGEEKFQIGYIYEQKGSLKIVSINYGETKIQSRESVKETDLQGILDGLGDSLIENISNKIYIRRSLKRYTKDSIFIIKPNEMRFWTKSSALRDADETYMELMSFQEANR